MPKPIAGESQKAYLKRAIKTMIDEGLPQKHAVGKSFGIWKGFKKKAAKRSILKRLK